MILSFILIEFANLKEKYPFLHLPLAGGGGLALVMRGLARGDWGCGGIGAVCGLWGEGSVVMYVGDQHAGDDVSYVEMVTAWGRVWTCSGEVESGMRSGKLLKESTMEAAVRNRQVLLNCKKTKLLRRSAWNICWSVPHRQLNDSKPF